jgi:NAD(P)-dependent dehydrogenase (short-subunit alcohol dehydrogenase family)
MSSAFTGKRIVVTGGAGGIGIETVRLFMEQGGHVLMVDVDEAALQRAQAQLGRVRLATIASALDTPAECARVMEALAAPAYALVHLAGLFERDALDPDDHGCGTGRSRRT